MASFGRNLKALEQMKTLQFKAGIIENATFKILYNLHKFIKYSSIHFFCTFLHLKAHSDIFNGHDAGKVS